MANLQQPAPTTSVQDYLDGESLAQLRHEYIDGEVYAMGVGSLIHNLVTGNIFAALHPSLDRSHCRLFFSDVKVRVATPEAEPYCYPDVVVTCDPDDKEPLFLERPTTIFEVLSESTERIDRNEKFLAYRSLRRSRTTC